MRERVLKMSEKVLKLVRGSHRCERKTEKTRRIETALNRDAILLR